MIFQIETCNTSKTINNTSGLVFFFIYFVHTPKIILVFFMKILYYVLIHRNPIQPRTVDLFM